MGVGGEVREETIGNDPFYVFLLLMIFGTGKDGRFIMDCVVIFVRRGQGQDNWDAEST